MNHVIKITLEHKPTGKQRARSFTRGSFTRHYTPDDTARYENLVKFAFLAQRGAPSRWNKDGYFELDIMTTFRYPASFSKKKRDLALMNVIRPDKKPDFDNIQKIIADGLNGIAWHDDKQVVESHFRKVYGPEDVTTIIIRRLNADEDTLA